MGDGHARFAELAVGHVLGGLPAADAAEFRDHLGTCGSCRARVAELRGIADELAAAEREERAREPVRTEVPRRVELDDAAPPTGLIGIRQVTAAVVVVALLAAAMGFWNLHLRTAAATYLAVAQDRGDVLAHLAGGTPLPVEIAGLARGMAAVDGGTVAVSAVGLAQLGPEEWLVAWLLDADDAVVTTSIVAGPSQLADGAVHVALEHRDASLLILTRESGGSTQAPVGPRVVSIELPGAS